MKLGAVAAIGAALMLCGCATIVRGQSEQVTFDSEPSGAEMRSVVKPPCGNGPCQVQGGGADGAPYPTADTPPPDPKPGPSCVTPCTLEVKRNEQLIVTFSKPGYEPQTAELRTALSNGAVATAGNVVIGGVVGVATDAVTQAGFDHQPNPMKVTLKPIPRPVEVKPKSKKR
jgi:hypothetical protein